MSDRVAVFVVFALNGATLGSWAPRVPALSAQVHAAPGVFGLALLGASVGMVVAATASGRLLERAGARTVVLVTTLLACALLPAVGSATSVIALTFALFGLGASLGGLDVAMNLAAVAVERRTERPIMPIFHAGYSCGALAGSAAAGVAAGAGWSPARHLAVAAAVVAAVLALVVRSMPEITPPPHAVANVPRVKPARRPALWLLAVIGLCSAIAEGASSDWSALLMVTAHGVAAGAAALAYSGFSLAMAFARLGGSWAQDRFGATRAVAAGALVAGFGLLLAAAVPLAAAGYAGFALAGAGLAAAFPVALSLAGSAGKRADGSGGERELAFVTAIAYLGFLGGPPLIGGIAQVTSLPTAFVFVALIAGLVAPAAVLAARARARERSARNLPVR